MFIGQVGGQITMKTTTATATTWTTKRMIAMGMTTAMGTTTDDRLQSAAETVHPATNVVGVCGNLCIRFFRY